MNTVLYLLILQGILGAYDVLWNHEWKEKLPSQATAALEQKLHGVRELFYAVMFIGLAWWLWQGVLAWLFFAVILIEILLTAWDFVTEDKTRRLSPSERVTHLILSMVGGAYIAFLIPVLVDWVALPSAFVGVNYGVRSWLLTLFGIGVLVWGIRDIYSGFALEKRRTL